jgi:hypothetical protein
LSRRAVGSMCVRLRSPAFGLTDGSTGGVREPPAARRRVSIPRGRRRRATSAEGDRRPIHVAGAT